MTTPPKKTGDLGGDREPIVLVIDDDMAIRESLMSLFRSVGLRVEVFGSAPEFLQSDLPSAPSCLVLDIQLPGISGLDLQQELADGDAHRRPPIYRSHKRLACRLCLGWADKRVACRHEVPLGSWYQAQASWGDGTILVAAVILGLLIFFNFVCQVILIAAAWISVGMDDRKIPMDPVAEAERLEKERADLESAKANEPRGIEAWLARRRKKRVGAAR